MGRVFQPLLFLLARCTRNELVRQIEWLKTENEMLRKRIDKKRIFLSQEEKARLMKLGQVIRPGLQHFITIVSYGTYLRWLRNERTGYVPKKREPGWQTTQIRRCFFTSVYATNGT